MPKTQTFHVVPHDGAWAVRKKAGGSISVFENKSDAIDEARKLAHYVASRVVVYGKSGQAFQSTPVKGDLTEKAIRDAVRSMNREGTSEGGRSSEKKRVVASKTSSGIDTTKNQSGIAKSISKESRSKKR